MKNFIIFIIIVLVIIGGVYLYRNMGDASLGDDRITSPTGGETLQAGNTYVIRWTDADMDATTTQIFLINTALESQGASASISDRVFGIPDTGSYNYMIPASTTAGTYRFEIGDLTSNTFQIRAR